MGKKKVRVKPIRYYGHLQGFKVYVDGKKYPSKHGHWYTTLDKKKAISNGLREARRKRR